MFGDTAAILWTWGWISHADIGWEQETGLLMAALSHHNSLKLPVSVWKQNSFIYLCCCNRDWCYFHLNTIPDNILSSLIDEPMTSFGLLLNKGTLKIYIFCKPFLFLIEELHFLSIKIETVVYNKKKNQWALGSHKHRLSPGSSTFGWSRAASLWLLCSVHQHCVGCFISLLVCVCGIAFTMEVKSNNNNKKNSSLQNMRLRSSSL